jgi:hypothetical protein
MVGLTRTGPGVIEVLEQYGRCLELVSLDPNFNDISVGLYEKDGVATVWTFSRVEGVEARIRKIRDQLVALGGFEAVANAHNQVRASCGTIHPRPTKFLMMQAVEKDPGFTLPEGELAVKDLRSGMMLGVDSKEVDGRVAYYVKATGEAPNKAARLRAVTSGFVRYGEMDKTEDGGVSFTCGHRHDELVRLLLPYARNVTRVEDMLEADALRGQMTTGTLGFSPPT